MREVVTHLFTIVVVAVARVMVRSYKLSASCELWLQYCDICDIFPLHLQKVKIYPFAKGLYRACETEILLADVGRLFQFCLCYLIQDGSSKGGMVQDEDSTEMVPENYLIGMAQDGNSKGGMGRDESPTEMVQENYLIGMVQEENVTATVREDADSGNWIEPDTKVRYMKAKH